MATTRLMPLHTGIGRTVGQAISAIIDYIENPQKTDGGNRLSPARSHRRKRTVWAVNWPSASPRAITPTLSAPISTKPTFTIM